MRSLLIISMFSFFSTIAWSANNEINVNFTGLPTESLTTTRVEKFSDLKGKVVLVDFWASWCEPCKEALPHYNDLFKKYKDQGVLFIGINEDDDIKERDAFLKANTSLFPMYADSNRQMVKDFKVQAVPSLFVFDKNLKAVALFRGYNKEKLKTLEKKIQELLK